MADSEDEQQPDDERVDGFDGPRPSGRVAFAQITSRTLRGFLPEELRKQLVAGRRVGHYGREWVLGQIVDEGDLIFGKLGFERTARGSHFDPEINDFVTDERDETVYSHFAIHLDQLRVAFQTRGQTIKPQSFVGALQALLNEASPTEQWRVDQERRQETFPAWLSRVERIERVRVKVERPNPNYRGRHKVEDLIEGLNAEAAELLAKARPDDVQGIDRTDSLLQELVGHADRYGAVDAQGATADGEEVQYHSGERANEVEVVVDPETRDVPQETLRAQLVGGDAEQRAIGTGDEAEERYIPISELPEVIERPELAPASDGGDYEPEPAPEDADEDEDEDDEPGPPELAY